MASPNSNSLSSTDFDPVSTGYGKYVASGVKWGNGLGTGATITFSFPTSSAAHITNYGSGEYGGASALTNADKVAVRAALSAWSSVANIKFVEVADNATTVGEMRFAYTTSMDAGSAAHAYYPGDYVEAGDVWINKSNWNGSNATTIAPGGFDFHTLLHEIGHALGLKHSFETPNAIPSNLDNYLYSVMSYTASPWSDRHDSYSSFAPTTPMYYDLLAIQAMYGPATSVNAGNTTYTFQDGKKYWQAINDTGGTDTIVYSGSESSTINLNPGQLSALSEAIGFYNGTTTRATVTIGPNVVIENATGGSGNDTLTGNAANNVLNGSGGNDTMAGGAGNDTYYVGSSSDKVVEVANAGTDLVYSAVAFTLAANAENLALTGNSAINATGNALANLISGNSGANTLTGLGGNDTYVVGIGDTVVEAANGGTDTVQSSLTITLGANLENLTLTGSNAINGTGNALSNVITGNAAVNTLTGLAGNDTYVVTSGDKVVEAVNAGTDTIQSSVTFTLAANAENLALTGSSAINGTGNALANTLTGNTTANSLSGQAGVDVLAGGLGNDTLAGGADADYFVFNTALNASANRDSITDFTSVDTIHLENAIFTAFASVAANTAISSAAFWSASGAVAAHDLDDRIIYNSATGNLYYDADGNKAGGLAAVHFATLTSRPGLTYADFNII